jgi:DNA-binding response OmpR family regulator
MDAKLKGKWVLIIDDDDQIVSILDEALDRLGLRRVVAHGVNEALSKLRKQKFDLVLLDLNLPQGNGEGILGHMRMPKDQNQDTPVMIMSGSLDTDLILRIRNQVSAVLVKPFSIQLLLGKVQSALLGGDPAAETHPAGHPSRAA